MFNCNADSLTLPLGEGAPMIPKSLGQITPEYLTNLLRQRYPDASVTAVTVHGEIHGTASKALLILDGTGDFPRRMWLKAG